MDQHPDKGRPGKIKTALTPEFPGKLRPDHKGHCRESKAQRQKGHRLRIGQPVFRADKSRAPDQHEKRRGDAPEALAFEHGLFPWWSAKNRSHMTAHIAAMRQRFARAASSRYEAKGRGTRRLKWGIGPHG